MSFDSLTQIEGCIAILIPKARKFNGLVVTSLMFRNLILLPRLSAPVVRYRLGQGMLLGRAVGIYPTSIDNSNVHKIFGALRWNLTTDLRIPCYGTNGTLSLSYLRV